MFESQIEKTVVVTAVILWFAIGWYLNDRLKEVHKKLDRLAQAFDGLRVYLYEIDPQFDDERRSRDRFLNSDDLFAGADDIALIKAKEKAGKRTLNSSFID